jgi:hypothetical protein
LLKMSTPILLLPLSLLLLILTVPLLFCLLLKLNSSLKLLPLIPPWMNPEISHPLPHLLLTQ